MEFDCLHQPLCAAYARGGFGSGPRGLQLEPPCAAAVVGELVLAVAPTAVVLGGTWRGAACTY